MKHVFACLALAFVTSIAWAQAGKWKMKVESYPTTTNETLIEMRGPGDEMLFAIAPDSDERKLATKQGSRALFNLEHRTQDVELGLFSTGKTKHLSDTITVSKNTKAVVTFFRDSAVAAGNAPVAQGRTYMGKVNNCTGDKIRLDFMAADGSKVSKLVPPHERVDVELRKGTYETRHFVGDDYKYVSPNSNLKVERDDWMEHHGCSLTSRDQVGGGGSDIIVGINQPGTLTNDCTYEVRFAFWKGKDVVSTTTVAARESVRIRLPGGKYSAYGRATHTKGAVAIADPFDIKGPNWRFRACGK